MCFVLSGKGSSRRCWVVSLRVPALLHTQNPFKGAYVLCQRLLHPSRCNISVSPHLNDVQYVLRVFVVFSRRWGGFFHFFSVVTSAVFLSIYWTFRAQIVECAIPFSNVWLKRSWCFSSLRLSRAAVGILHGWFGNLRGRVSIRSNECCISSSKRFNSASVSEGFCWKWNTIWRRRITASKPIIA